MANLITGRNTVELAEGKFLVLPVAAGVKIYDGALVVVDDTGFAKPATKAENLIAVGRAEEFINNVEGGDGDKTITVRRGVFIWENDTANPVTEASVMKNCYIVDDNTVSSLATGSSVAGKVIAITEDGIAVETI